jgi:hypothetical protein
MREIRGLERFHGRRKRFRWRSVIVPVLFGLLLFAVVMFGESSAGTAVRRAKAQNSVEQIVTACQAFKTEYSALPETPENYRLIEILRGENPQKIEFLTLKKSEVNANEEMIDPWKTPYRIVFGPKPEVKAMSAGPDKVFGTKDDITNP